LIAFAHCSALTAAASYMPNLMGCVNNIIALQHAMHAERDIVMANPSVCLNNPDIV